MGSSIEETTGEAVVTFDKDVVYQVLVAIVPVHV